MWIWLTVAGSLHITGSIEAMTEIATDSADRVREPMCMSVVSMFVESEIECVCACDAGRHDDCDW